jgi:hypothetical protein
MASLTELCSICFASPPKYTCPRCNCQTCSLPCVKLHKKRAACSGVRNPAAYLKSSELATPASIDRDYNFITKVQRDIERAEDEVAERGGTLGSGRGPKNAQGEKSKLELEYEAGGVTVIKAPLGLTRSKQNKTHWDKRHGCVMWTVEWVLQNDQRVLANVQGGKTVLDAFTNGVGKKGLQRKRKLGNEMRQGEERPLKQTVVRKEPVLRDPEVGTSAVEQPPPDELGPQQPEAEMPIEEQLPPEEPAPQRPAKEEKAEEQQRPTEPAPQELAAETPAKEQPPPGEPADPTENAETEEPSPPRDPTPPPGIDTTPPQLHFYLHRPRTSTKETCLIPILPSTSVSEILRDRTILDYPTIYARAEAEDELRAPFITEKEYEERYGVDVVPRIPVFGMEEGHTVLGGLPEHIDERKIMEVLKRDVVS